MSIEEDNWNETPAPGLNLHLKQLLARDEDEKRDSRHWERHDNETGQSGKIRAWLTQTDSKGVHVWKRDDVTTGSEYWSTNEFMSRHSILFLLHPLLHQSIKYWIFAEGDKCFAFPSLLLLHLHSLVIELVSRSHCHPSSRFYLLSSLPSGKRKKSRKEVFSQAFPVKRQMKEVTNRNGGRLTNASVLESCTRDVCVTFCVLTIKPLVFLPLCFPWL